MPYLCISKERVDKTSRIMAALRQSLPDSEIIVDDPPTDYKPFFVWGQMGTANRLIPLAIKQHRPFWHIDNGFWKPAKGTAKGYYRFCYRGLSPILLCDPDPIRCLTYMNPWRKDGKHVLIAYPGRAFGRAIGLNMDIWCDNIRLTVRKYTDRPIVERPKYSQTPLLDHLTNCWALVTHSSNVAIEAVVHGVPVFVADTSPAAPVGNLSIDQIENPRMPSRTEWWQSLMSQQFTLDEMADGTIRRYLDRVVRQADGAYNNG